MQCSQKVGQKKWSHNSSQKTSRTSTLPLLYKRFIDKPPLASERVVKSTRLHQILQMMALQQCTHLLLTVRGNWSWGTGPSDERTPNRSRTDPEGTPNGFRTGPNGFRTDPERTPNEPRTDPERTPNGSRTDPERTPNEPRTDPARTPGEANLLRDSIWHF